ncbi:MAG: branched-chain amino acid ABC transporter permease [Microbacteriaceae bacterium]
MNTLNDGTKKLIKYGLGALGIAILALLPIFPIPIPGILPDIGKTPAAYLNLIILCLIYAAFALTYHLLLGVSGMLSFGHALFFGAGAYLFGIMLNYWGIDWITGIFLTFIFGGLLALGVGSIANRVNGIPFAMVTLAFAEAGAVLVKRNAPITNAEEGLFVTSHLPDWLIRVRDTGNLYWVILALFLLVFFVVTWVEKSRAGSIAKATRENELRVKVLGIQSYKVKVIMFVAAGGMASLVGTGYMIATQSALPRVISADTTILVLVMVVLGGVGYRWGAIIGAVVFTLLDHRLVSTLGDIEFISELPPILSVPLSEPLFILGVLFILVVLFLPGGIVGTIDRLLKKKSSHKSVEKQPVLEDSQL